MISHSSWPSISVLKMYARCCADNETPSVRLIVCHSYPQKRCYASTQPRFTARDALILLFLALITVSNRCLEKSAVLC